MSSLPLVLSLVLTVPAPLQAGAATSNITPPLGTRIVGGFAPYPAEHIHDELHARCLVLDDGQTRLALVVCDLLGHNRYREGACPGDSVIGTCFAQKRRNGDSGSDTGL